MPMKTARIFWADRRFRYLVVGGFNTLLGYAVFAVLFYLATRQFAPGADRHKLPIWAHFSVLTIANIICITMAYLGYKFLVFRTRGNYRQEYLRTYAVYAVPTALGFGLYALMVNVGHLNPYAAQALIMMITIVISYLGHKHVTFRQPKPGAANT